MGRQLRSRFIEVAPPSLTTNNRQLESESAQSERIPDSIPTPEQITAPAGDHTATSTHDHIDALTGGRTATLAPEQITAPASDRTATSTPEQITAPAVEISRFPIEIQSQILSNLHIRDLKSIRISSQTFGRLGERFLITRAYAAPRTCVLHHLNEIASPQRSFRLGIKTIRFGYLSVPRTTLTKEDFLEILNQYSLRPVTPRQIKQTDFDTSYDKYLALCKDREKVIERKMDVDQITKALHHFPNLQNIEFGPESWVPIVLPGGRRARQSGVRIWHENEHGTGTGVDDIEAFDEAERFWEIASNALSGCKIHHLSTASGDGFRGNFETERLWSLECVPKLFSQLHSVDLRIPFHSDGLGRLPQVLSELKLERIYITNHSSLRVLDILFESTVWSTLSHLQLSLSFDADTITAIFAKHKALRYLSISDSYLTEGSWQDVFQRLRKHEEFKANENEKLQVEEYSRLTSVQFQNLSDGHGTLVTSNRKLRRLSCVESYIICGGEDPFAARSCSYID